MSEMFCFQCQQTAGGSGCVRTGVCGKQPETAALQDELIYALMRLALAALSKFSLVRVVNKPSISRRLASRGRRPLFSAASARRISA